MSIRNILSVVTTDTAEGAALRHAVALAGTCEAHLDVLCLGVDMTQSSYQYFGEAVVLLPETLGRAEAEARTAREKAAKVVDDGTATVALEIAAARLVDVSRGVGARARFSDVAVLPLPYGEDMDDDGEAIVEGALFDGGVPVIAVPNSATPVTTPRRVLVAWDESAEAMRAVKAALPILTEADRVTVLIVDPPVHGANRSDPGGGLAQFLARHGAEVDVAVVGRTMPRISDVLNRTARDEGADMIVMGAYGHSRWREAVLGGTTRDMLREAQVPLFLAH